jgi:tetrahydromethanopterin:alpha-L-glutamate ligase
MNTPRIGIVGIPDGWSTLELARAVEAKTVRAVVIDMRRVALDFARGTMRHGDVDLRDFDALIVKKIAADYSPDALDRIEMLSWLEGKGVRIFSRPRSMFPLIDRLSGTVRLQLGGIPMPDTVITEDIDEAAAAVERLGRCIAKPLYTSKARGMTQLSPGPGLRDALTAYRAAGNPMMYLQRMIEIPGQDLGISFLGGEYVATYARVRSGTAWSTSTATGGKYAKATPSQDVIDLAHRAQALFDLAFTCVDVVETTEGPMVFEVSAFGGFRGLKDACDLDAASLYTDWVIQEVRRG